MILNRPPTPHARRTRSQTKFRPVVERLEDRLLLTDIHWNAAASGNWNDLTKWAGGAVPLPGDNAIIDATGADYTVTLDVSPTVSGFTLNSSNATFSASSKTFTVNGPATLSAGTVQFSSSTWTGSGTLTNASSLTFNNSTISTPLVNQSLLLVRGNNAINSAAGSFTTNANSILRMRGDGSFSTATLTVANGFTNNGLIELTDEDAGFGATLNVTNGTLTNAALATIQTLAGAAGPRTLNAQLDNQAQGTLTVNQALTINKASADHVNSGTINLTLLGRRA